MQGAKRAAVRALQAVGNAAARIRFYPVSINKGLRTAKWQILAPTLIVSGIGV
jgi:hypothetical protein